MKNKAVFWTIIGVIGCLTTAGGIIGFIVWKRYLESKTTVTSRQVPASEGGQPVARPRPSFLTNEMWLKPCNGDLDGVKEMLDQKPARLEERVGGMRATLLHIAAYCGQPEVVAELLRRNPDVNLRTSQGHTPLYDCISGRGNVEIARMLLEHKADFTIADNAGKTPLQIAIERNRDDYADLLRQYGAKK